MTVKTASLRELLGDLPDFEQGAAPGQTPFRLDRTRALLAELGHPEDSFHTVHVVGTKGKGSVAAMLTAILTGAGYHVGTFTSPHLLHLNERFAVQGHPMPSEALQSVWLDQVQPAVESVRERHGQITMFEALTVLAFVAFGREAVEVAIVEAGLGGSLDATNAMRHPSVIVLTPISLDHTEILGSTLTEIATDKAGVIKPGTSVVMGLQSAVAERAIVRRSQEAGATLRPVRERVWIEGREPGRHTQRVILRVEGRRMELTLPLQGRHQAENAGTAVLAVTCLVEKLKGRQSLATALRDAFREDSPEARGLAVPVQTIIDGLQRATLRGRFEQLAEGPPVIADVAHNVASARALDATVREVLGRPPYYVVGMAADKDHAAFAQALSPNAQGFICVQANHPRAMPAEALAERIKAGAPGVSVESFASVADGLRAAGIRASQSTPVVVTGSFHVVAAALRSLQEGQWEMSSG